MTSAHQSLLGEQPESIVDRGFRDRQVPLGEGAEHLFRGQVLGPRKQDSGDLDTLWRRRDITGLEGPGGACALARQWRLARAA